MNIPNLLSLFRILLVPPFLIAILYDQFAVALLLFIIAGLTDFLDGFLARRLHQKSLLGTYLDPIGDKLLTTTAFVALAARSILPAWLAVIVVAKDLYITLGAAILHLSGQRAAPEPSFWGKLTTFIQIAAVCLALFYSLGAFPAILLVPIYAATACITAISGVHYIWSGISALSRPPGG